MRGSAFRGLEEGGRWVDYDSRGCEASAGCGSASGHYRVTTLALISVQLVSADTGPRMGYGVVPLSTKERERAGEREREKINCVLIFNIFGVIRCR